MTKRITSNKSLRKIGSMTNQSTHVHKILEKIWQHLTLLCTMNWPIKSWQHFAHFKCPQQKGQHFALFWYQNLKVGMAQRMFSLNGQNLPLFDTKILPKDCMAQITYSPKLATYNKFDKWTVVKKNLGRNWQHITPLIKTRPNIPGEKSAAFCPVSYKKWQMKSFQIILKNNGQHIALFCIEVAKVKQNQVLSTEKMGSILHSFFGGSKLETWSNPKFSKNGQHFALFYIEHCKGEMALKIFTEKWAAIHPAKNRTLQKWNGPKDSDSKMGSASPCFAQTTRNNIVCTRTRLPRSNRPKLG